MARTSKSRSRTPGLTPQQRLFAHEVVRCHGNQTEAAIAAGYTERSARNQGARLMANEDIRALVAELQAKQLQRVDSSADAVLKEARHVAMARLSRVLKVGADGTTVTVKPLEEWTEDELAGLTDVDVMAVFEGRGDEREHVGNVLKLKMRGKQGALELLAKHHGLLRDVVEHKGTIYVVDPYASPPPNGEEVRHAAGPGKPAAKYPAAGASAPSRYPQQGAGRNGGGA